MKNILSEIAETVEALGLKWIEAASVASVARTNVADNRNKRDGEVYELRKVFEGTLRALVSKAKTLEDYVAVEIGDTPEKIAATAFDTAMRATSALGDDHGKTSIMLMALIRMSVRPDMWPEVCALADEYADARGAISMKWVNRFIAANRGIKEQLPDAVQILKQSISGRSN